jgi:hypothetical protein
LRNQRGGPNRETIFSCGADVLGRNSAAIADTLGSPSSSQPVVAATVAASVAASDDSGGCSKKLCGRVSSALEV